MGAPVGGLATAVNLTSEVGKDKVSAGRGGQRSPSPLTPSKRRVVSLTAATAEPPPAAAAARKAAEGAGHYKKVKEGVPRKDGEGRKAWRLRVARAARGGAKK